MMDLRRFGPLICALGVCLVALITRLYDVQIREHDVWAREAANLVRSWFVEPYRRGAILDRKGRTLVKGHCNCTDRRVQVAVLLI